MVFFDVSPQAVGKFCAEIFWIGRIIFERRIFQVRRFLGLGLFGLALFMVEQRTKEIGIRKVLGASISSIFILVSKEFVFLVLIANAFAWPTAYFLMRIWLQNFAYRVNMEPLIFVISGAIALLIALLTVSYQAIKAATADPVDSLRYE